MTDKPEPLSVREWIHLAELFVEGIAREMGYSVRKVKRARTTASVYIELRGPVCLCVRLSDHHSTQTHGHDRLFSVKYSRSRRLFEFRKWLMVRESKQRQEEPAPKTAEQITDAVAQTPKTAVVSG